MNAHAHTCEARASYPDVSITLFCFPISAYTVYPIARHHPLPRKPPVGHTARNYREFSDCCIIPAMSDAHERPPLSRNFEQDHPYAGLEQFWKFEMERRNLRQHSRVKALVGSLGLMSMVFLVWTLANMVLWMDPLVFVVNFIPVLIASVSSVWLLNQGLKGAKNSRPLPPPRQHRSIRGGQESHDKSAQRQLLEVIEANGEITPARAALHTSLTVEEAERLLSDLAQRGHLDVRVQGSKLMYSL